MKNQDDALHVAGQPIIEVNNVSKRFARQQARASDLRERFTSFYRKSERVTGNEFWALKDVQFTVSAGESVGIVGHNGSGKSTLLKMLTGIIKPTTGTIHVRGRVGALIEVGAGFHPDLSGRENIFLNGSILGLSRKEIASRFEEIVAFAGLESFIDTPVKRYSSGMYMRLGFAVAAHTNPEIMLIDEVMAVGDTLFQNRCIRFLKEYLGQGGTVVFVSHALDQVKEICQRCIWLDYGTVRYIGDTETALQEYLHVIAQREEEEFRRRFPVEWATQQEEKRRIVEEQERAEAEARQREQEECERERRERQEREEMALRLAREEKERKEHEEWERRNDPNQACLLGVTLLNGAGQEAQNFAAGEAMEIRIRFYVPKPRRYLVIGFEILRQDNLYFFAASNHDYNLPLSCPAGEGEFRFRIHYLSMNEGTYRFRISLFPEPNRPDWDHVPDHVLEEGAIFSIHAGALAHGCAIAPVEWQGILPVRENRESTSSSNDVREQNAVTAVS